MSDIDSEEERMLASARRAWSATSEDAARVLRGTQLAILGLPAVQPGSGSGSNVVQSGASKLLAGKWLASMLVAVLGAGSAGYLLGYRAGERATRPAVVQPATAHAPEPPLTAAVAPSAEPPAVAVADGSLQPVAAVKPAALPHFAQDVDAAPSLQAETRVLRKVERALRDGRPELALRLLATLDRTTKNGALAEERFAAWTLARCAQTPAPERSREFCTRYPGSVYRSRVEQACLGAER